MVNREIAGKLKELHQALKKRGIRVTKIILYGSRASGRYHKDSDIDIAVVSPDFGKDRFEEGVMLFQIACKIDPRFEPVPLSVKSYKKDTWIPLIYEIRKNGKEIKVGTR
jgi:predicted nucleotidyltransferase